MPPPGPHTSHYAFRRLLHHEQMLRLDTEATYLAERPTPTGPVRLYHFPAGFFVEASFNVGVGMITEFRAFNSAGPLAVYAALIELPAGLLPNP